MATNRNNNDATRIENTPSTPRNNFPSSPILGKDEPVKPSGSKVKLVTVGGITGVLVGTAAAVLTSMRSPMEVDESEVIDINANSDLPVEDETHDVPTDAGASHHDSPLSGLVDPSLDFATGINDSMSFNEAFTTARAEVGAGGVFEWRGNIYSTYTAQEWNALTPDEQDAYNDNFAWNHHSSGGASSSDDSSSSSPTEVIVEEEEEDDDDIEIIDVVHNEDYKPDFNEIVITPESIVESEPEPEVEILNVVVDDDSNSYVGIATIDGEGVIFVDVDQDMTFDVMVHDDNHNGEIEPEEIHDISDAGLTVEDMLSAMNTPDTDNLTAELPETDSYEVF